jgi:hypothetical protein
VALLSLKSSVREGKVTVITKTGKHDTFELNKRVLLLGEKKSRTDAKRHIKVVAKCWTPCP